LRQKRPERLENAGAVGIIIGLIELVKFTINSFLKKNKKEDANTNEEKINYLLEWHNRVDSNGVPLGYSPRTVSVSETEILTKLDRLTFIQDNSVNALDKIASILEKVSDRQMSEKK
jgi:hypothetical protein